MSAGKSKLSLKLLIFLIVSAAYILARFGYADADELKTRNVPTQPIETVDTLSKTNHSGVLVRSSDNSLAMPMIKLLGALVLVVACIYGFLFILRRMMGSKYSGNGNNRLIEVFETTHIGQKKSISLVRYHDKAVLVGVSDGSISVLAELDSNETGKILAEISAGKSRSGFKDVFTSARSKMKTFGMKKIKDVRVSDKIENPQAA